jgi:hypothetical protein
LDFLLLLAFLFSSAVSLSSVPVFFRFAILCVVSAPK